MYCAIDIPWWTWGLVGLAGVFLTWSALLKFHRIGACFFDWLTRIVRRPWFEVCLLLFCVGGLVHYGATKGANGADAAGALAPRWTMASAPTVTPEADGSSVTTSQIQAMIDEVNTIYRQVGLHFSLGAPVMSITNDEWAVYGLVNQNIGTQIRNSMIGTGGVEVYFVPGLPASDENYLQQPNGSHTARGIVVKESATGVTLAHEIGHAYGWGDVYDDAAFSVAARGSWLPGDWSNGTGCRYYDPLATHSQILGRLLMLGKSRTEKSDIPHGSVQGVSTDGVHGLVNVGVEGMLFRRPMSR